MIIRDDGFIVKGRKFTPSDVERILINYVENENENKIKFKHLEHEGESLVDFCKRAYEYDQDTCDNYHTLFIRRPYVYKGMKKGWVRNCYPSVKIVDVLKDTKRWKDYIIKCVHYGSDCSINVTAELPSNTLNDLIRYCEDDISKDCIFQEVLTNEIYDLNFVKTYNTEFEDTVYIKDIDIDENKKITCVHYMKNGGNKNA